MFQFFKKITSPFSRLKAAMGQKIRSLFSRGGTEEAYDQLERMLYEADLGAEMASAIVDQVRGYVRKNPQSTPDDIIAFVKQYLLGLFPQASSNPHQTFASPHIILVVGVNGSGKTTSVAKLAQYYRSKNYKVLIGAADTFRAAAVDQLELWAKRIGADLIKAQPKSDPSAVVFDTLQAALARGVDVVLLDTAGRLQNKTDLMQELAKIRRVIQKLLPDAPHETLLVLDATIGQNAIDQAEIFHQFTPISGIVLTKLDGTAKGGIAAAIHKKLAIPIVWAGLGEGAEDLIPFDAKEYIDALFKS
jgi:fused signal recognition particle receptor